MEREVPCFLATFRKLVLLNVSGLSALLGLDDLKERPFMDLVVVWVQVERPLRISPQFDKTY